jgi:hypothetical protein
LRDYYCGEEEEENKYQSCHLSIKEKLSKLHGCDKFLVLYCYYIIAFHCLPSFLLHLLPFISNWTITNKLSKNNNKNNNIVTINNRWAATSCNVVQGACTRRWYVYGLEQWQRDKCPPPSEDNKSWSRDGKCACN